MKLKLNLENFENIEFKAPDLPVMEQYRYFLERLHEWEQVTGNVKRLIKNIEKILEGKEIGIDFKKALNTVEKKGLVKVEKSVDVPDPIIANPIVLANKQELEMDLSSKPLPEIKTVNPITEEVTMDLKGVTGMAQTPKAILVTKMGLQKWIPLSCLILEEDTLKADGTYYDELKLLKGKSWILDKPWDKLEVRKS